MLAARDRRKPHGRISPWWRLVALCALFAPLAVHADPMRPLEPATAAQGVLSMPGAAGSAGTDISASAQASGERADRGDLKAIRQNGSGKWEALIGARWFGVGERVQSAKVLKITPVDVVLQSPDGQRDTLSLLPRVLPQSEPVKPNPSRLKP